jgi:enediyne biosynthesis protein E4
LSSCIIENLGNGKFKITELPVEAQTAPVNGIVTLDANQDGMLDILMVGNDYGNEPTFGQYDAFLGLLLLNDGKANFRPASAVNSGFYLPGDAKALAIIDAKKKGTVILASQNKGQLEAFGLRSEIVRKIRLKSEDSFAIFFWKDQKKQRVEFHFGNGYLSQSSRIISVPDNVEKVVIYNYQGKERVIQK